MQHSADDASPAGVGGVEDSLYDKEEDADGTENRQTSGNTPQDMLNSHRQLAHCRKPDEAGQELYEMNDSLSRSVSDDGASLSSNQSFLNHHITSSVPRRQSGEAEQCYPEIASSREEDEGHTKDLPVMFHLTNSDDDAAKIYCCHICTFKTAFKNSLVNHQAVHSDARPWICEMCDYSAKRKQDLKKHLQTMHGLIIDSPSLRPGMNPVLPMVSSELSGQLSPVEMKPQIIGDLSATPGSLVSVSGPSQHRHVPSLVQPLPPSAQQSAMARSSMPAVGRFIADKFPFNLMNSEMSCEVSGIFPQSAHQWKARSHSEAAVSSVQDEVFMRAQVPEKAPYRDDTHSHRLASGSDVLPKEKVEPSSVRQDCSDPRMFGGAVRAEVISRDRLSRSEVHVSTFLERDIGRMQKRSSEASRDDRSPDSRAPPARLPRFQSQLSESDLSPQVTSQSDHSTTVEPISSTATHSRGLETKKSFHCPHCDILFFENALYLMHMGLHDNNNPWKCAICNHTFFEKYSFTSHFINQH